MRFHLFECQVKLATGTTTCHIIAASEEHAALRLLDHYEALGVKLGWYSILRVDHTLPEDQGGGRHLDDILENAPAGLVSLTDIGWVAHSAPVHKLRLYASEDHRGAPIYAIAPNAGVALTLMVNMQLPKSSHVHALKITDVTDSIPEDRRKNLDEVLTAGQAGIAECDDEHNGWWVW
ncbi:hypothetical protein OIK40_12000 [Erythrobacter sp. sf7]|uniref:Uncharacterized protein n=1 Tax=Erythrobacter fulvus TaxID=2987523 RepID=A0ABT5JRH1_9SPHN|nr:hypothetical protein [Erythrobacter fulvus]MDC8755362.1 hypothetical protein [Erythrobacter fulvus]